MAIDREEFYRAYMEAALWSSLDNDAIEGYVDREGECLDDNFDVDDISDETKEDMIKDCNDFIDANEADLEASELDDGRMGHNFWLNREGHGSGFWDEYSYTSCPDEEDENMKKLSPYQRDQRAKKCKCPYHACERLSEASRVYGDYNLWGGEDGKVYHG